VSFLSRGMATLIGIAQSFVIIRLLTQSEWGLVQLAVSIGGALGIYQHLGLASASTREVSASENKDEIFKIFVTSAVIRYCITLPLAIGLFLFAEKIAVSFYKNSGLIVPLKIYAATLLFQGFQSILNSVISGTKRFKTLFGYQVVIAFISLFLYIPLVYLYKVNGFFLALLGFNAVASVILAVLAFYPLKGHLKMPSRDDFKRLFRDLFSISFAIYFVKIIYTNWEKLGTNVLGIFSSTQVIAIFAFAMLYAKKLMNISDSATDVSLPVFSEHYVKDIDTFKTAFQVNFNKLFFIVLFFAIGACYWVTEAVYLLLGAEKLAEYSASIPLILPLLLAFIFYSFINLIKSSVLIPAKLTWHMIISYLVLLMGSLGFFWLTKNSQDPLLSMSWSIAVGSLLSFLVMSFSIKFKFFNIDHWVLLLQAGFISSLNWMPFSFFKIALFVILMVLFLWGSKVAGFMPRVLKYEKKA